MARRTGLVLLIATVVVLTGFGGATRPLRPGDHLGKMVLRRGTAVTAGFKLFDICNPPGSGRQHCGLVPDVRRLFIGYGSFAPPDQISQLWTQTTWSGWLDGHRLQLSAFGSSDRTLDAYPPAGGQDVTLREWRVVLVGATPGRDTIRYRSLGPDGNSDVTWIFTVARS
ncbi:MAG: hypothetical protein C5B48_03930 [Candidatus Rokuibacteriota bacterium]|nr:MAG: hypothetical protein C5B48_03930 [Candidatus Rokubacteria bacterium]